MRTPARPPLDGLKKRLDRSRAERELKPRDGFLRETFVLPRTDARDKAKEWFDRWPKQAYWTEIESWFERPGDVIEFTIRRLPAADLVSRAIISRLAPGPCLASRSSGLRNGHLSIDMQPQPMQSVSPSRSFSVVRCAGRGRRARRLKDASSRRASACGPPAGNRASRQCRRAGCRPPARCG